MIELFIWIVAGVLMIATVSIHYEAMKIISDGIIPWARRRLHGRRVMTIAITGLLIGHVVEIWLFALATFLLVQHPALGAIKGDFNHEWMDFLYLSTVNYTSLGDGGIRLIGPARAIAAAETLGGMMMIGWSASFTYLKMELVWRERPRKRPQDQSKSS